MAQPLKGKAVWLAVLGMSLVGFWVGRLPGHAGQNMPGKEIVSFPGAQPSKAPFSTAVRAGDYVFLSGVIGSDLKTGELVSPDISDQTRTCLEKLKSVLSQVHMELSDVVNATVYLSDISDYDAMNKVYASYFPSDPPARACVQVGKLVRGARVEIAMMAWKAK
jgi:2-iminobutanoate/2-iminopropanoate deaminase